MWLALWLKFKSYIIGAVAILVTLAAIFLRGRSDGIQAEKVKQQEANNAATKRKAAVKPNNSKSTSNKLRKSQF